MDLSRLHLEVGDALERRHSEASISPVNQMSDSGVDFPHPHYAMIYLDHNGELRVKASASMAGCGGAIFTPEVTDNFVKLANPSPVTSALPSMNASPSQLFEGSPFTTHPSPGMMRTGPTGLAEMIPCQFLDQNKRRRRDSRRTSNAQPQYKPASPTPAPRPGHTVLRVGDRDLLRRYYEKAFEDFQQLNCRTIAKSYIKLVEPRKQVHFPYNGRKVIAGVAQRVDPEQTKPAWWPVGVLHREPDHLLKRDRLKLLVHILCELKDSHGITAQKLREAGQDVRRQITPTNRVQVLDEIYFVRELEERFLDGDLDANARIQVRHTHLPEAICHEDDLSSSIYIAPLSLMEDEQEDQDEDSYGVESHGMPLDDNAAMGPVAAHGSHPNPHGLPLSPTTSDSSGPHSPGTYGAYTTAMPSRVLATQPSPATIKDIPIESTYLAPCYGQQFMPSVKASAGYWPTMAQMPQNSSFGY
ncbi:Uncharacterized protein PECH_003095 [Penicillium ucsense]|uniref:Subtelomeric hrmA-associated cluster protein AFUB-079030/YDR124W-like helical bundle domain-containing protein n=1 Tax=Penicillium ucsense TaxID=2839758 RepID=A0A8J8VW24_9EURO|nr:Uncharacterized protein PECM_002724 [Penicillium ucsense]KAF7729833.1 Uncharacterized protein PECH_003095 [Penicillium ucsense]